MDAAPLCPQCLAKKIIATQGGPTCQHQPAPGVKWWPADWAAMDQVQRIFWLRRNPSKQ